MAEQKQQSTAITVAENKKNIVNIVQTETFQRQLTAALMARVPSDYVVRSAISTINNSEKLQKCTPLSVAASILLLAQAGLAPEPWKGHGYLIPRNTNIAPKGQPAKFAMLCTPLIGYRGYVHLAYRSPRVTKAGAHPVYEGDVFDLDQANGIVVHHPWIKPEQGRLERGAILGAYAFVKMKDGEPLVEWMTKSDIDEIRKRSAATDSGPWVTDYTEMARKTPFRRLFKWVPDEDLQKAAAMEEASDLGNMTITMDPTTGEIITQVLEDGGDPEPKPTITQPKRIEKEPATIEGNKQEQPKQQAETTPEAVTEKPRQEEQQTASAEATPQNEAQPQAEVVQQQGGANTELAGLFESGAVKPASSLPPKAEKKPGSIGDGRAKRLYAIIGGRAKELGKPVTQDQLAEKLKQEILAPLGLEKFRDMPEDIYDRVCEFARTGLVPDKKEE